MENKEESLVGPTILKNRTKTYWELQLATQQNTRRKKKKNLRLKERIIGEQQGC